jgi:polyribonucleotide 5'-hydroxyl-kinase
MMIDRTTLQVLKGHAEVFGAELADGKYYLFGHECKAAIFTWQGCTIEMSRPSFEFFPHHRTYQSF